MSHGRTTHCRRLRLEPLEDRRLLASLTVNSFLDNTTAGDGLVTLGEAILAANNDTTTDLGDTGSGADTIVFDPAVFATSQTIQLASELVITKSLAVNGPGANLLTIEAFNPNPTVTGDGDRVLTVDDGTAALIDVELVGLSITSGDAPFGQNGGAILNREDLTIIACTISDSHARLGGAIWTAGNLTVIDSTINGNSPEPTLGGVGGGIYSQTNLTTLTTTIINSTISGNDGAGVYNALGKAVVRHSTITASSRGIESAGNSNTLTEVYSTIIADNSQDVRITPSTFNSFQSLGYNLVGTGNSATSAFNEQGDQVIGTANPQLESLADNGGPTRTHRTLAGSPAIDAGEQSAVAGVGGVPLFDQRGEPFARVTGRIDIGSFEREAALLLLVDSTIDEDDGDYSAGDLSLREAIRLTNESDGSTVMFDPLVFSTPQTILLTLGELELIEALMIVGPGQNLLTIDAQSESRIFNVTGFSGEFVLQGMTLVGGNAAGDGGAIYSSAKLSLQQITITGNTASGSGGAIRAGGGVTISSSTVSGNSDVAVTCYDGPVIVTDSTVTGGVGVLNGSVTITDSVVSGELTTAVIDPAYFSGNVSLTNSILSGSIDVGGSVVSLLNSHISGGRVEVTSPDGGGAVQLNNSTVTGSTGRGISAFYANVTLTNSEVSGHSLEGINAFGGDVTLVSSTVSNNGRSGIRATFGYIDGGEVKLNSSTITGNHFTGAFPYFAGGIDAAIVTLNDSTVSDNSTLGSGGGISANIVAVTNSTISGNTARDGGGIFSYGHVTIKHSTIVGNHATQRGGGINQSYFLGTIDSANSIIAGNSAPFNPDLYYWDENITVTHSIIGDQSHTSLNEAQTPDSNGNLIGTSGRIIDPRLGPLADNGGPTKTHALMADSPAIDRGDPAAVAGIGSVPVNDQRGSPFERVHAGRIDMGAFESQPMPAAFFGDYNTNGTVDTADYVLWRMMLGSEVANYSGADGDGDGQITDADYDVWVDHFGEVVAPGAGSSKSNVAHADNDIPMEPEVRTTAVTIRAIDLALVELAPMLGAVGRTTPSRARSWTASALSNTAAAVQQQLLLISLQGDAANSSDSASATDDSHSDPGHRDRFAALDFPATMSRSGSGRWNEI